MRSDDMIMFDVEILHHRLIDIFSHFLTAQVVPNASNIPADGQPRWPNCNPGEPGIFRQFQAVTCQ